MSADPFTEDRQACLTRAADNPNLSCIDYRVLLLICNEYLNRENGEAWPAPATLAERLQVSKRAVRYSQKKLLDEGLLELAKLGGGTKNTTHYRLANSATHCTVQDQTVQSSDIKRCKRVAPLKHGGADRIALII